MKKLFRDFIVFIFLTSFFFSILFFLNGEKFSYKDLKIIFDVDVDTSHLLSKNIEKNTECQKRKKGYYLYILFLLLVLFLLLIIVKLLLSLKHDCEKYEIYSCEKDKTYEDESKSKLKLELDMSSSADEIEKNNEKINELSNEIDAYVFQAKGGKFNKSSMPPKTGADQEYKYDSSSYAEIKGFRVANFNPENQYNRSLFWKKESFRIKQQLTSFYGLKETDKETFSKLYDDELQRMNTASSDLDAFTNYYISKKTLMCKNERIEETLAQQAQKMNGVVNCVRRQNEKEMIKERIAFQEKDDTCKDFFENLNNDNDGTEKLNNEYLLVMYKKAIIKIILQSMIENFMVTQNEPQNFRIFCSKYYDVFKENNLFKKNFFSKQKKEEVLNSFKQSSGYKMSGNDREKMYYKFYFLAQKGIYFPLHEIANFHNLSLKVLTTQTEAHANKFINPKKSIKVCYNLVGKVINQLQEEIYNAVELIKRRVQSECGGEFFRKQINQINQIKQVKREAKKNINEKINEHLKRVSNNSRQKKQNIAETRAKYPYLRPKNKKQTQNINPNIKTFKNSNDIDLSGMVSNFSLYSRNQPRSQSQFHQNKSTLSTRRKYQEASEKKKKNEDGK